MAKSPKSNPRNKLSERQEVFIDKYLLMANASKAAEAAGYDASAGSRLLAHPTIAASILSRQSRIREDAAYDVKAAMREAEEAIDFSRATRNANAYVKAVELRSKLMGLLVEKLDVRQLTNFRINILGMPGSTPELPAIARESIAHLPMSINPDREVPDDVLEGEVEEDIFGL